MPSRPILIIDDDPEIREVLRQALTREGYAVMDVATGGEGIVAWEQYHPPLIILGLRSPEMTSWQILEQIRQDDATPVLLLTHQASEDEKIRAFELGADDYLSQPFSPRELIVRVQAVLRRSQRLTSSTEPTELLAGDLRLDLRQKRVSVAHRTVTLTRIEFQILRELARTPGQILSREQLLTAIWGPEYCNDKHILRCAIYRLRQKLEPDARQPCYLRGTRGLGYWLAAPEET